MSIHSYKTSSSVVAELNMTRTQRPNGSFLLIEGTTDKRFWTRWVDEIQCDPIVTGGKTTLLGAVKKLDSSDFRGALGVADADHDRLRHRPRPSPNLVWTNTHDLEASLVQMGAARAVVHELGEVERLKDLEQREDTTLEAALLERALQLGRIRCAQAFFQPSSSLTWLKAERFLDDRWQVKEAELAVAASNEGLGPGLDTLQSWFATHKARAPWDLVNGHDLVAVLTLGLRSVLGSLPRSRGKDDVGHALRLAVDSVELLRAPLIEAIKVWERATPPYVALRRLR